MAYHHCIHSFTAGWVIITLGQGLCFLCLVSRGWEKKLVVGWLLHKCFSNSSVGFALVSHALPVREFQIGFLLMVCILHIYLLLLLSIKWATRFQLLRS